MCRVKRHLSTSSIWAFACFFGLHLNIFKLLWHALNFPEIPTHLLKLVGQLIPETVAAGRRQKPFLEAVQAVRKLRIRSSDLSIKSHLHSCCEQFNAEHFGWWNHSRLCLTALAPDPSSLGWIWSIYIYIYISLYKLKIPHCIIWIW